MCLNHRDPPGQRESERGITQTSRIWMLKVSVEQHRRYSKITDGTGLTASCQYVWETVLDQVLSNEIEQAHFTVL
jgi:hypothetical protein